MHEFGTRTANSRPTTGPYLTRQVTLSLGQARSHGTLEFVLPLPPVET